MIRKKHFIVSTLFHLLPLLILVFVYSDNIRSDDDKVRALVVDIKGVPGLEIGRAYENVLPVADSNNDTNTSGQGGGSSEHARTTYSGYIVQKINEYKYYPQRSKLLKQTGSVELEFILANNGSLVASIKTVKSSGYKELDEAALNAIKKSSPFEPFPKGLQDKEQLSFTIKLEFVQ